MADTATDPRTVQLKSVILSFTDTLLTKKRTSDDPNAKEKHGCNVIITPVLADGSPNPHYEANKAKCATAVKASGERQWKNENAYQTILEDDPKRLCYRKGESFKNKETREVYKGYEGNMAISGGTPGASQKRPKLFDRRKRPVAEADILDVMYGGTYADVIISFYGTDKGGSRGIFSTIEAIRSHEEGQRMGGGVHVDADDFDNLPDADNAFEGAGDLLG